MERFTTSVNCELFSKQRACFPDRATLRSSCICMRNSAQRGREKLRGMFAFAIWDENKKRLLLARDRVGIKPVYYALTGEAIVFASEIKAILADPAISRNLAPEIIDRFLTFLYVPGEETLLKACRTCSGSLSSSQGGQIRSTTILGPSVCKPTESPSIEEAENELSEPAGRSCRAAHDRDVPVGFFSAEEWTPLPC